jgi:UDP-glucose 4-epimerase
LNKKKFILVTGGAGYIGSHICKELYKTKYIPVTFDNLSTGHKSFVKWGPFVKGDIQNYKDIKTKLNKYKFFAVIHCAANTIVTDSYKKQSGYINNNVLGTSNILEHMKNKKIKYLVFSSSCSVYGQSNSKLKFTEKSKLEPKSFYGLSKKFSEELIFFNSNIKSIILRYFNAAGADKNLCIGEKHFPETHLIPSILNSILNKNFFYVYGKNYLTKDGSCVRDYVHVTDIAIAHIKSLNYLIKFNKSNIFNLGTGKGFSIFEVLKVIKKITGKNIYIRYKSPRLGDPAYSVANSNKIKKNLNFNLKNSSLKNIIMTAWNWHNKLIKN